MSGLGSWKENFLDGGQTVDDWNALEAQRDAEIDLFTESQKSMRRQIEQAFGSAPVLGAQLSGGKVCLSCGAIQPYLGTLPCDH